MASFSQTPLSLQSPFLPPPLFCLFEGSITSVILKADTIISQMGELNSLLMLHTPFRQAQLPTRVLKWDNYNHPFIVCSFYEAFPSLLTSLPISGIHIVEAPWRPCGQASQFPNIWLVSINETLTHGSWGCSGTCGGRWIQDSGPIISIQTVSESFCSWKTTETGLDEVKNEKKSNRANRFDSKLRKFGKNIFDSKPKF